MREMLQTRGWVMNNQLGDMSLIRDHRQESHKKMCSLKTKYRDLLSCQNKMSFILKVLKSSSEIVVQIDINHCSFKAGYINMHYLSGKDKLFFIYNKLWADVHVVWFMEASEMEINFFFPKTMCSFKCRACHRMFSPSNHRIRVCPYSML